MLDAQKPWNAIMSINNVRTKCPHTVISCKYKGIGCTSQLKRKDMPAHEQDDKLHLRIALDAVSVLQGTVSVLQDTCLIASFFFFLYYLFCLFST
jgi:hypothetical protein